jgi:starch synthase
VSVAALERPRERRLDAQGPAVVVAHPGRQHVYETVLAAQDAGLLQAFATGVFLGDGSLFSRGLLAASQLGVAPKATRNASNRNAVDVDASRVRSFPRYHAASRLFRPFAVGPTVERLADRRCDAAIARWLGALDPPPAIVHGFEGSALATLSAARARGAVTVLDVPSAHEWANAAVRRAGGRAATAAQTERLRAERACADIVVVPSDRVARCLVENGVEAQRIVAIPLGVDVTAFAPTRRPVDGVFRVLFAGTVSELKGVRHLLAAWDRLDLEDAELVLAGGADADGTALLRSAGRSCRWLGPVPRSRMPQLYASADAFVLPSLSDGFGLVIAEAMACGLPVVTTTATGVPLADGEHGLVVPPGDVAALAGAIRRLHEDAGLRRDLGAAARRHAVRELSWDRYRARLVALYRAALAGVAG